MSLRPSSALFKLFFFFRIKHRRGGGLVCRQMMHGHCGSNILRYFGLQVIKKLELNIIFYRKSFLRMRRLGRRRKWSVPECSSSGLNILWRSTRALFFFHQKIQLSRCLLRISLCIIISWLWISRNLSNLFLSFLRDYLKSNSLSTLLICENIMAKLCRPLKNKYI